MRSKRLLAIAVALLMTSTSYATAARTNPKDTSILSYTIQTPKYHLAIDGSTGQPLSLAIAGKPVMTFDESGWWRATFEDGSTVDASQTRETSSLLSNGSMVFKFTSDKIAVQLHITPAADHVDLRAYVRPSKAVITRFALPQSMEFAPDSINEVDYPEELGRALKPAFFKPQPSTHAHWKFVSIGAKGAADVGILPCQMLDYSAPPVDATVTPEGKAWLGSAADSVDGWTVRCPRPPQSKPDVTLIDTANGPLLSMETVDGGWGWFIRWSGLFSGGGDDRRQMETSAALLHSLWTVDPLAGKSIHPPSIKPLRDSMPHQIGIIDQATTGRRSASGRAHWGRWTASSTCCRRRPTSSRA